MHALRTAAMLALALPGFAQSTLVVVTKDGQRHAYNVADVVRIEFAGGTVTPPPPPPPPPPPSAGVLDTLLGGKVLPCEARQGGKVWPGRIRITQYSRSTGEIAGELTWTTLNSVHRVQGRLSGSSLTFTEVQAIRAGSAHLNVSYALVISAAGAKGTWSDHGDGSTGTAAIFPQ